MVSQSVAPGSEDAGLDAAMVPAQGPLSRLFLGPPVPNSQERAERLSNPTALAILSSDALSSVAYATEEMMKVLVPVVGLAAFSLGVPVAGAIVLLLLLLVFSYRQTIKAYPSAGGAYIVTRDNFGLLPAQVAGVSLLMDYVMTVAVSVSAGVAALYSYFPALFPLRVPVAVALIWLITLGNLRGIRASGRLFSAPTYAFIIAIGALLLVGVLRGFSGGLHPLPPPPGIRTSTTSAAGLLLLLHAYASGTTALTGVEAVSNGVTVFRPPEATNARKVLLAIGVILVVAFSGITLLAWKLHPVPTPHKTLISEVGSALFGRSGAGRLAYLALQVTTTAILVLAANTSFSDFPRLASFHAGDGYLPRPLRHRGPRLGFTVGILSLATVSTFVVVLLGADVHRLIPLYAVGVFASFTFSQGGMTRRHLRLREERWKRGLAINALGALGSGLALVAIVIAKFSHGAWAVIILVPAAVTLFIRIHNYYGKVERRLADPSTAAAWTPTALELVLVADDEGIVEAGSRWAQRVAPEWPVEAQDRHAAAMTARRLARPPRGAQRKPGTLTVFVLLRRPAAPGERSGTGGRRDVLARRVARTPHAAVAVATVVVETVTGTPPDDEGGHALVVVAERPDARARAALALARMLNPTEVDPVIVDLEPEETGKVVEAWSTAGMEPELQVLAAPYREPGGPLRWKAQQLQRAGLRLVTLIEPAIVVPWWQRPLYRRQTGAILRATASCPGVTVLTLPLTLSTALAA